MNLHTGQVWGIAFKVQGCLDRCVSTYQGTVGVKLEQPCDTMPLEFAGGFSLLPPWLWLWVRGFILTSSKSQEDDSGALTGSPGTRGGPSEPLPLEGGGSGSRYQAVWGLAGSRRAELYVCDSGQVSTPAGPSPHGAWRLSMQRDRNSHVRQPMPPPQHPVGVRC